LVVQPRRAHGERNVVAADYFGILASVDLGLHRVVGLFAAHIICIFMLGQHAWVKQRVLGRAVLPHAYGEEVVGFGQIVGEAKRVALEGSVRRMRSATEGGGPSTRNAAPLAPGPGFTAFPVCPYAFQPPVPAPPGN